MFIIDQLHLHIFFLRYFIRSKLYFFGPLYFCYLKVDIYIFYFILLPVIFDQLEGEEAQRTAKRRLERERGRREATADMSEDLSEGEKGDTISDVSTHGDSIRGGKMPRISSVDVIENLVNQLKEKKLYIVLIRHGLKPLKPNFMRKSLSLMNKVMILSFEYNAYADLYHV